MAAFVDLYGDTETRPTPAMRKAMADLKPGDLLDGISVAKPPEIAAYMMQGNVKVLTY